jgi:hypothetical protein
LSLSQYLQVPRFNLLSAIKFDYIRDNFV